jgi:hypothetical protein
MKLRKLHAFEYIETVQLENIEMNATSDVLPQVFLLLVLLLSTSIAFFIHRPLQSDSLKRIGCPTGDQTSQAEDTQTDIRLVKPTDMYITSKM